ncbi:hypothetical protein CROQUDRAFT_110788 [Cronartium quercuum f. sp. fusiforme G11]|uniref:Uncharacterized protein n=1 Tax=Cronartium quercuum f. sp. fusiforme G11 TaxID=708437 RepID=A0A9P6N704_9BASI|nr:hypothetical protein CROQUDRAFT_110788 [Cronartium quercuum f. sp. fusiforme G11]
MYVLNLKPVSVSSTGTLTRLSRVILRVMKRGLEPKIAPRAPMTRIALDIIRNVSSQANISGLLVRLLLRTHRVLLPQTALSTYSDQAPFENTPATELVQRVNLALEQLKVTVEGKQLEVKGAASLPSGGIELFTATTLEANWILENWCKWLTLADPDLVTSPAVVPVLIDLVPRDHYPDTEKVLTAPGGSDSFRTVVEQTNNARPDQWPCSRKYLGQGTDAPYDWGFGLY